MDKFDRWGFGFWFAQPLSTPQKQEQTYDVREKLEWAKKMGVSLQFDLQLNQTGSAEGILDDTGMNGRSGRTICTLSRNYCSRIESTGSGILARELLQELTGFPGFGV